MPFRAVYHARRMQAVPAIVPTLVVAYCLHLPLVEVHVTTSCLVLIVQLRVHTTYPSSSLTAMWYGVMEAVFVVVEASRFRYTSSSLWPDYRHFSFQLAAI